MSLSIGELVGYVDLDTGAFGKGLDWVESKLGGAKGKWAGLLGGAGIAAGGAFAASLVGAMNIEPGQDRVAAALDLTATQADRAGKVAGTLYAGAWGDSMEDVNGAVEAVMSSIGGLRNASAKDLQAVTEAALTFSTAMEVDVSRAASVAGVMVKSGLAKNATDAFDLLTKASSQVPKDLREDVLDATEEYSQFFNTLGISGPQAMGMLAKGAAKGQYGIDKVGDAVKEFTIRATDGSKSTATTFESLGLNAQGMTNSLLAGGKSANGAMQQIIGALLKVKDPGQQAAASLALFGTPLEDLNTSEIPKFLKGLQSGGAALGDWQGATKRASDTLNDNAATNLTSFTRQLKMGFIDMLGGKVLPAVTDFTGVLATQLGPTLSAVGSALGTVTGFLSEHGTAVGIVAGLITALLVPGWILAGIAAVQSGYQQVRAWVMQQGAAIKTVAMFVASKAVMVGGWVLMGVQAMLSAARMAAAWFIALGPVGWVIAVVVGLVALIITHWSTVKKVTLAVWSAIVGAVKAAWGWIKDAVAKGVSLVAAVIRTYVAIWKAVITTAFNAIRAVARAVWAGIVAVIRTYVGLVVGAVTGIGRIGQKVREYFGNAKDAAVDKLQGLVSYVKGIPGKILSAVGNLGGLLKDAGRAVIQGLLDGIEAMIGKLKDKLSVVTNLIPKHKGPMVVDAKLLTPNGEAIMGGLLRGIQSQVPALERTLGGITNRVPAMAGAGASRPVVSRERTVIDRSGPLIGKVEQQPGESADQLAERLWFKTRTR